MKPSIIILLVIATAATIGCGPLLGNRHEGEWTLYSSSDPDSIEAQRLMRDWKRRRLGEEMRAEMTSRQDKQPVARKPSEPNTANWREFVDVLNRLEAAGGLSATDRQERLDEMSRTKPEVREAFLRSITATLNFHLQKLEARDRAGDRGPPPDPAPKKTLTAPDSSTLGLVFDAAAPSRPANVRRYVANTSSRHDSLRPPKSRPLWPDAAKTTPAPAPSTRGPWKRRLERPVGRSLLDWSSARKTADTTQSPRANQRAQVEQTAYHEPARDHRSAPALSDDSSYRWQDHVLAAVDALEEERASAADKTLDTAFETRLRLLYLAAGRKEEALADLPRNRSMSNPERLAHQEFLQAVVGGLDEYMTHDRDEFEPAEANLAKVSDGFRQAADHIGKLATLNVNNVTLCQKVDGFGVVEPFASNNFRNQQEVLLYAEVQNFVSKRVQKNGQIPIYLTELKSSYRVFNSEGRVVGQGTAFKTITDRCRNYRRDFFISYFITLPEQMFAGTHTLKLDVTDTQGQKFGQGSVEFEVVAGDSAVK